MDQEAVSGQRNIGGLMLLRHHTVPSGGRTLSGGVSMNGAYFIKPDQLCQPESAICRCPY